MPSIVRIDMRVDPEEHATHADPILEALASGGLADITTIGRRSGEPRRIEIVFHSFEGELVLTGRPGRKRDWEANIGAHPQFTLHLTQGPVADLNVVGELVTEPDEKARLIRRALVESWNTDPGRADEVLHDWVERSPLVRFRLV